MKIHVLKPTVGHDAIPIHLTIVVQTVDCFALIKTVAAAPWVLYGLNLAALENTSSDHDCALGRSIIKNEVYCNEFGNDLMVSGH